MNVFGYKNTRKKSRYQLVDANDQPVDLAALGVTKLEVAESGQVLSSEPDQSGVSRVTYTNGEISVQWGAMNIDSSSGLNPTIYAYQGSEDTEGTVLIGPGMKGAINFTMLPDDRESSSGL